MALFEAARIGVSLSIAVAISAPGMAMSSDAVESSDSARAIAKGREAKALYQQGNWSAALERFREAERLYHSPVFRLYEARSLRNAGHLLEARIAFRRLTGDALPPSAPESWERARSDARKELVALESEIPSVIVLASGASLGAHLTIDGVRVALGGRVELDPGSHSLAVIDAGVRKTQTFVVALGMRGLVIAVSVAPRASPPKAERSRRRVPVGGVVLAATGGASLLAGTLVGIVALRRSSNTRDNLPASCSGTTCPESQRGEIEADLRSVRRLATAADVLLFGGGALAALGGTWILLGSSSAPSVTARVSSQGASVHIAF